MTVKKIKNKKLCTSYSLSLCQLLKTSLKLAIWDGGNEK